MSAAIVWLRGLLRLHDNPVLTWACSNDEIDTDTGLADSVVYYNFCGMGTQQDSVIDNIFQITNSEHGQGSQVFVSWSVRGVANNTWFS